MEKILGLPHDHFLKHLLDLVIINHLGAQKPRELFVFLYTGTRVHVHVTPYQIQDERRPWIKKEEKTFSDTLSKLGTEVLREVHFANSPPNLFLHFDVINVFCKQFEGESSDSAQ